MHALLFLGGLSDESDQSVLSLSPLPSVQFRAFVSSPFFKAFNSTINIDIEVKQMTPHFPHLIQKYINILHDVLCTNVTINRYCISRGFKFVYQYYLQYSDVD